MEKFFYRVNSGDSVLALAAKFSVPPALLIKDNNLKGEIQEGDVLFICGARGNVYPVQPFDTLSSVAARFNVPEEQLTELNGVDYIFYGLNLLIPE